MLYMFDVVTFKNQRGRVEREKDIAMHVLSSSECPDLGALVSSSSHAMVTDF